MMDPCEKPDIPASMTDAITIRDYSIAATQYIVELQEQLDICDARLSGVRTWTQVMTGRVHQ